MPHRILTILPAAVLALTTGAAPAQAAPAAAFEAQTLSATNDVRARHGLRTLRSGACLAAFADSHARRMAERHALVHQDLRRVQRRCGVRQVAENVAVGHGSGAATVRSGWMKSAAHRANIMDRSHRRTAVGAYRDARGEWWTVQLLGSR